MYQIVKFPFPFADDIEKSKPRPALVISKSHGKFQQLVIAYITSDTSEQLQTDVLIDSSKNYFFKTGLESTSIIKLHRLATTTPSQIRETFGVLPDELIFEVKEKLRKVFQL